MLISCYILLFFFYLLNTVYSYSVDIPDKIIIIGDTNVFKMVRNFYNEVILKYEVPHFSMIVWDKSSYDIYKENDIPVEYSPIGLDDCKAEYNIDDPILIRKKRIRNEILLYYLKQNLTILNMDSDLFFYKNPLELLNYINREDDIVYQCDNPPICDEMCYGLFYIKPSKSSIKLFERSVKLGKIIADKRFYSDQNLMNIILKYKRIKQLKQSYFGKGVFPLGVYYSVYWGKFVDDENVRSVIGFHNNNMLGESVSKIYRFKELGVWKDDENEYYSSKSRKYIKYSSIIHSNYLNDYECIMIYLMYLGEELNRTIIFPRFSHNQNNQTLTTNFINFWNLKYFEERFGINYRENISFFNCFYNINNNE